jgi:hypothetical protein
MSRIAQWTLDVHDVELMARFWSQALGYRVQPGRGGASLLPPEHAGPDALAVWLQPTSHPKRGKNRNHPDLRTDRDVDAEVDRLVALGAHRVDVGQAGTDPFVVLADPGQRVLPSALTEAAPCRCAERRQMRPQASRRLESMAASRVTPLSGPRRDGKATDGVRERA